MSANPNAPIDVKINIPTRIPSQDPARIGKFDLLIPVEYGPFSRMAITVPEELATPQYIDQQVREQITKLKALGGRTIQV